VGYRPALEEWTRADRVPLNGPMTQMTSATRASLGAWAKAGEWELRGPEGGW